MEKQERNQAQADATTGQSSQMNSSQHLSPQPQPAAEGTAAAEEQDDNPALQAYQAKADALEQDIKLRKSRAGGFVLGELLSFGGCIACVVLLAVTVTPLSHVLEFLAAVASIGLYIFIRWRDAKNSLHIQQLKRLQKTYAREAQAMKGDFSAFDDGKRYEDPHHPFTFDLDIFGEEGLFQRVSHAVTTGGADRLADLLGRVDAHASDDELQRYAEAIGRLSTEELKEWRMEFFSHGVEQKIDTAAILHDLPLLRRAKIPKVYQSRWIAPLTWAFIGCFALSVVGVYAELVDPIVCLVWLFVNFFLTQFLANRYMRDMLTQTENLNKQMRPLVRLVRHMKTMEPQGQLMKELFETLSGCVASFERASNIVQTLTLRSNIVFLFCSDAMALRGIFLVRRYVLWRNEASDRLEVWLRAIAEIDALVSMAQFASCHPETTQAEVTQAQGVQFEAEGLWHPFLRHAVSNDFTITDRNFYIVTGANMAGKSTFLRAVGINYVLAMNGMPVFASHLRVSRFRLFSSMRTSDDLAHGISYFNAELLRLRQLIAFVKIGPNDPSAPPTPVLIILDEILKGTNSADKLNGSRLFLRNIMHENVSGIVATHDLELSKMADESPRFHNYCFEIDLGQGVTYSYKITPGVARNQNATFLLKQILNEAGMEKGGEEREQRRE